MGNEVAFDDSAACERCGRFGAFKFDSSTLCGDCYETRGSCCPEFSTDDLWERDATGDPVPRCARAAAQNREPL